MSPRYLALALAMLVGCSVELELGHGVRACPTASLRVPGGACATAVRRISVPGHGAISGTTSAGDEFIMDIGPFADSVELEVEALGGAHVTVNGTAVDADESGAFVARVETDRPVSLTIEGPTGDSVELTLGFRRRGEPALLHYVKAPVPGAGDAFGSAVALGGRFLVVGAPLEDSAGPAGHSRPHDDSAIDAGAAHVYRFEGAALVHEALLKGSSPSPADRFGAAVAVDGTTLVVGCPGCPGPAGANQGAAFVFARDTSRWTLVESLRASNADATDEFGASVSLDGDLLVIGASDEASGSADPLDDSAPRAGAAYVFRRHGGRYVEEAYLKSPSPDSEDAFGTSVWVTGARVLVGAPGEDGSGTRTSGFPGDNSAVDAGAAYAFARIGGVWTLSAYLKGDFAGAADAMGMCVVMDEANFAVGAAGDDRLGTEPIASPPSDATRRNNGSAYVFGYDTSYVQHRATLDTALSRPYLELGASIAIEGRWFVSGAPGDNSASGGIDPPMSEGGPAQAGGVYVFEAVGGDFAQVHLLRNPALAPESSYDRLGAAVALRGGLIAASSPYEDGRSVGVDGNPAALGTAQSGAVFVWR